MKKIGKIIFISIILSLVIGIGFVSAQQFQSIRISTITAEATVTGGELAMFVEIRRRDNNNTASNITWTVPAGNGWTLADQYILLHSTVTQSGGGIRIYTDNNAADANPKYGGSFGENNGAGLISTSSNTAFLPMAWLIKDDVSNPTPVDPNTNSSWFYFKDRSQTNFWSNADTRDYSTVARAGYGYHFAQGPSYGDMSSPNPIYIEANFVNAVGGWTYKTTTLRIELFSE